MNGKLSRYVLSEVGPLYLGGVLLFYFLQMTNVLSGAVGAFLNYRTGISKALTLLSYQLPSVLNLCLVVAVPFAILLAFGRLAKDSELKAAYSGGVQPLHLIRPLLLPALLLGAVVFINAGYISPAGQSKWWNSFYTQVFNQAVPPPTTDRYAYSEGGILFTAGQVQGGGNTNAAILNGVVIHAPQGTYSAAMGNWDSQAHTWTISNGYLVKASGEVSRVTAPMTFAQHDALSAPPPPVLQSTTAQLRQQLATQTPHTEPQRRTAFELARRLADPFTPLVFVLAAGTLGLALSNRAWALGATILFLVGFYALYSTAPQLAAVGALSAVAAAWLPNLAFVLIALGVAWRLR